MNSSEIRPHLYNPAKDLSLERQLIEARLLYIQLGEREFTKQNAALARRIFTLAPHSPLRSGFTSRSDNDIERVCREGDDHSLCGVDAFQLVSVTPFHGEDFSETRPLKVFTPDLQGYYSIRGYIWFWIWGQLTEKDQKIAFITWGLPYSIEAAVRYKKAKKDLKLLGLDEDAIADFVVPNIFK